MDKVKLPNYDEILNINEEFHFSTYLEENINNYVSIDIICEPIIKITSKTIAITFEWFQIEEIKKHKFACANCVNLLENNYDSFFGEYDPTTY